MKRKASIFAAINITNIEAYQSGGTGKLRISIKIDENDKIKIDNIVIEGNTTTNKNVIVREITLGEGTQSPVRICLRLKEDSKTLVILKVLSSQKYSNIKTRQYSR